MEGKGTPLPYMALLTSQIFDAGGTNQHHGHDLQSSCEIG